MDQRVHRGRQRALNLSSIAHDRGPAQSGTSVVLRLPVVPTDLSLPIVVGLLAIAFTAAIVNGRSASGSRSWASLALVVCEPQPAVARDRGRPCAGALTWCAFPGSAAGSRAAAIDTVLRFPIRVGHQALADGPRGDLRAALGVQLLEDVLQVVFHRVLADAELGRDLLVAQPRRHVAQDLDLAVGEAVGIGGVIRGSVRGSVRGRPARPGLTDAGVAIEPRTSRHVSRPGVEVLRVAVVRLAEPRRGATRDGRTPR